MAGRLWHGQSKSDYPETTVCMQETPDLEQIIAERCQALKKVAALTARPRSSSPELEKLQSSDEESSVAIKGTHYDGSFRSDPHSPRTCADSAFLAPEVTQDNSAGTGYLTTPRDLRGFKRRLPPLAGERAGNRSWEAPEFVDTEEQSTEEDAETRKEEAAPWRSGTPPESEPKETLEDGR
ncbi:hypothetical protein NDU88_002991 [Pleurodeles waltl]|uniref:Uncharacterized protein n=1 Tax=Pleurodeles waltl TaxID=8319 RepID=A0AAV7SFZ9_PLEWA|nr:hypothetical protein NDU88_002991 [Pleurodeles waltl]